MLNNTLGLFMILICKVIRFLTLLKCKNPYTETFNWQVVINYFAAIDAAQLKPKLYNELIIIRNYFWRALLETSKMAELVGQVFLGV